MSKNKKNQAQDNTKTPAQQELEQKKKQQQSGQMNTDNNRAK